MPLKLQRVAEYGNGSRSLTIYHLAPDRYSFGLRGDHSSLDVQIATMTEALGTDGLMR